MPGVLAFALVASTISKQLKCIAITNMIFPEGFRHCPITGTAIQRSAKLGQKDDLKLLEEYTDQVQKVLESWLPVLNRNGHNSSVKAASPEKNTPNAIVCIDEARTLFDGTESLLFRSLLEALRKQFAKIQGGEYRNLSRPHGGFCRSS